jgi:hypothetical protein
LKDEVPKRKAGVKTVRQEIEMTPEESTLIEKRKAGFEEFYNQLMPCLVDFVAHLGIKPAHQVLKQDGFYKSS